MLKTSIQSCFVNMDDSNCGQFFWGPNLFNVFRLIDMETRCLTVDKVKMHKAHWGPCISVAVIWTAVIWTAFTRCFLSCISKAGQWRKALQNWNGLNDCPHFSAFMFYRVPSRHALTFDVFHKLM